MPTVEIVVTRQYVKPMQHQDGNVYSTVVLTTECDEDESKDFSQKVIETEETLVDEGITERYSILYALEDGTVL